jgi:hypothetical protein
MVLTVWFEDGAAAVRVGASSGSVGWLLKSLKKAFTVTVEPFSKLRIPQPPDMLQPDRGAGLKYPF